MRQSSIQVERVVCWRVIHSLAEAVAQAVVGKGVSIRPLRDGNQPVGGVVGVCEHRAVAVIRARQAIEFVVGIGNGGLRVARRW